METVAGDEGGSSELKLKEQKAQYLSSLLAHFPEPQPQPETCGPHQKNVVHELFSSVVFGQLPLDQVEQVLSESGLTKNPAFQSCVADVLWFLGIESDESLASKKAFAGLVKHLNAKGLVDSTLLLTRLESEHLDSGGVLSAKEFQKRAVRVNLRHLYTLPTVNLLREESEGYSKLFVELTHLSVRGKAAAGDIVRRVQSLIGVFDLDPNRVLDIILEVYELDLKNDAFLTLLDQFRHESIPQILGFKFQHYQNPTSDVTPKSLYLLAAHLIKRRVISWEEIYSHLRPDDSEAVAMHAQRVKDAQAAARKMFIFSLSGDKDKDLDRDLDAVSVNPVVPPRDVAPDGRDDRHRDRDKESRDGRSESRDARPDSRPAKDGKTKDEKKRKADGDLTASRADAPPRDNQKFGLVYGLLELDEWDIADTLLRRLGRLDPASHEPIARVLCNKLATLLDPYYTKISPYTAMFAPLDYSGMSKEFAAYAKQPAPGFEHIAPPSKRKSRKEKEPEPMRIPSNVLLDLAFPILRHLNLHLHIDIILYCKITRIFRELLRQEETEQAVRDGIEKLIVKVILPGLSLIPSNPGVTLEVWELLKLLPYTKRYDMYYQWKNVSYSKAAELIACKAAALFEAKKMLRRISTETTKQQGRNIGKISHSNAPIIFDEALSQVAQMDSLIQPLVDGLKYCTPLAFDVLAYSLIEKVAMNAEDKLKRDGTSIAMWFQNVAMFTGAFYRKYFHVEFAGMLNYIVNQLKDEQSIDLVLLRELIAAMTGIEIIRDMGSAQLEAQAGGETLRVEASIGQQRTSLRKPSNKLRDVLTGSKLMIPLLVLIAQQRGIIIYNSESRKLKLIGDLYDKCQETFLQYTEFLTSHVSAPVLASVLPSVLDLCKKYSLDFELALHASRFVLPQQYDDIMVLQSKKLARSVPNVVSMVVPSAPPSAATAAAAPVAAAAAAAAAPSDTAAPASADNAAAAAAVVPAAAADAAPAVATADAPTPMDVDRASTPSSDSSAVSTAAPAAAPAPQADSAPAATPAAMEVDKTAAGALQVKPETTAASASAASAAAAAGEPVVSRTASLALLLEQNTDPARSLLATARQLLPPSAWQSLSPQLWVTFWSLSLYDIVVPAQQYKDETRRLEAAIFRLDDPSNPDAFDSDKRKKERTRLQGVIEKLKTEQAKQEENHQEVMQRIQSEKNVWLDNRTNIFLNGFIQFCVLPRMLLSLPDAVYCARFTLMLHRLRTPHFCSFNYYDGVIRSAVQLLACCTDHEAARVGVFLQETLETLFAWRDLEVFNRECAPFPGFLAKGKPITHATFMQTHFKWHNQYLARVMSTMFESNEYMTVRNALAVCVKLVKFFPATRKGHLFVSKRVKALLNDERPDIKMLANMYNGLLSSREDKMLQEEEFKLPSGARKTAKPAAAKPAAPASSASSSSSSSSTAAASAAKPSAPPAAAAAGAAVAAAPAKPAAPAKKPTGEAKESKDAAAKDTTSKDAKATKELKTTKEAKEGDKDKAVAKKEGAEQAPAPAATAASPRLSSDAAAASKRTEKAASVKKERSLSPPPLSEEAERASKRRKATDKPEATPAVVSSPALRTERKEREERPAKADERPAKQAKRDERPESREKGAAEGRDAREARATDKPERDRAPRERSSEARPEEKDVRKDDKRDSRRDEKKEEPKKKEDEKSKEADVSKERKRDVKGKDVPAADDREPKRRRTDEGIARDERQSPVIEPPTTRDDRDAQREKDRSDRDKDAAAKQQTRKEQEDARREEEKERRDEEAKKHKHRSDKDKGKDKRDRHERDESSKDRDQRGSKEKDSDKREPERESRPADKDKRPEREPEKERPKEKEPEKERPKDKEAERAEAGKPKTTETDEAASKEGQPARRIIKFPKRDKEPAAAPAEPAPAAPAPAAAAPPPSKGATSSGGPSSGRSRDRERDTSRDEEPSPRLSRDASSSSSSKRDSSSSSSSKQSDKPERDKSSDSGDSSKKQRNYRTKR